MLIINYNSMFDLFNINTIFFTFWGYPMSYLEFFGTIFNLWCVWLTAKNKVSSWPIGIIGVILYIFLFYQIQLYSDFIEQLYFLVTGFWGWYVWTHPNNEQKDQENNLKITDNPLQTNLIWAGVTFGGTLLLGYFMSNVHLYFPAFFPEAASFAYLDAFTTVMSIVATILMVKKKVECWYLWILVDIIGICLYYVKDVKFIALEYLIFLILAIQGLIQWRKAIK